MKRVLMVSCGGLGNGGVQSIMMGIIRNLYKDYHFDMLLFTSEERFYDKEFLSYGGSIFRIPLYEGESKIKRIIAKLTHDYYVFKEVNKLLCNQESYDVIHCNKQLESAPILKAAAKHLIPIRICHTHVLTTPSRFPMSLINKWRRNLIAKYSTNNIGCSNAACRSFFEESAPFRVFPNFYDDNKFVYTPLTQNKSTLILVQVGAISETKNQLFSVRVLKTIISKGIEARLRIIGFDMQQDYKDYLVHEVLFYGLSEKVDIIPGDSQIPEFLKDANAFLMPSKSEGFGIVLIEAQAVGLQCFASNHVPIEANCGGITYLDIDHSDASEKWASIIIKRYKECSLNHQKYNMDKYKKSNVIRQFDNLYKSL